MSKLTTYKFSELYDMSSGISSKPEQAGHGFPFASFSTVFNNQFLPETLPDLMDTSEKERKIYSINKGDIFLTRTSETLDELGMSCVSIKNIPNATYSGFLKRLRPKQTDISYHKFMAFYLRSKLFRKTMSNNAIMTLRASLNEQIFSYLDLLLPEYKEQKNIGDYLYLLNQKIELNNKINTELEAMAKLIYDYWFVQFDFPDANGKPYKSSGGKMVYNDALKREIPEGWKSGSVDEECSVRNGYAFKSESYTDDGYTIVRTKNFKSGSVEYGDMVYISTEDAKSFDRYHLSKFDFLLVMVGASVGKNVIVNSNILPALQNQNMWCFRSRFSVQHFTNQLLKIIVVEQLSTSSGSAREFFKKESFREAKFANPDIALKKFYVDKVAPIYDRIDIIKNENQKLIELRDWLLPMLMNGQVTVK
ncbi:MAG: restriction endonuclease subunit S [Cellvibrionaceae bacterium]